MEMKLFLNPEKHGLKMCPHCNGYGSSLKESADTCTRCGGSGLVPIKERRKHERKKV